jgi:hypothetical protein
MRPALRPATTPKNSPFDEFTSLAVGRSWPRLANLIHEPTDGKIFVLHSDLIHSFFCSALTKTKIDRLVGYLFDKDLLVLWPNFVLAPYCAENPPPLVRTITFFILHLIYE